MCLLLMKKVFKMLFAETFGSVLTLGDFYMHTTAIQVHPMPRPWLAQELSQDSSWVHWLSSEAIAGFEKALTHAKNSGKPWLQMTSEDFPLSGAAKGAIDRAFGITQKDFGMCLIKGFPVQGWSVEDARLAHWGIGLNVGVARTQNQASQVMNDVRDEGATIRSKMDEDTTPMLA